jgi:hypothetical protein
MPSRLPEGNRITCRYEVSDLAEYHLSRHNSFPLANLRNEIYHRIQDKVAEVLNENIIQEEQPDSSNSFNRVYRADVYLFTKEQLDQFINRVRLDASLREVGRGPSVLSGCSY